MPRIHTFKPGSRIPEDILKMAANEKIRTAGVEAIGGVDRITIGYYNARKRKYEQHEYAEFLEATSLLGNITIKDDKPFLHMHGTFARRDMSVIGGHVVAARVKPLLELVLTPLSNRAIRRFDEKTGLNAIYKVYDAKEKE